MMKKYLGGLVACMLATEAFAVNTVIDVQAALDGIGGAGDAGKTVLLALIGMAALLFGLYIVYGMIKGKK